MITVNTKKDLVPKCPHCEQRLETIDATSLQAALGKAYAYSCPSCEKGIGVSHRKGFWMG